MFWIGAFYLFKSSSCPMLFYRQDVSYYKWIFFKRCVGHIDCLQSRHQCCLLPNCPGEGDCTERGNELIVSVERVLEQLLFVGKSELIDYLFHNCGLWQECSCASSEDRLKKRHSYVGNVSLKSLGVFGSPCKFNSFCLLSLISPDDQKKVLRQEKSRQWFIAGLGANKHL